jgi:tetratricopeptide (TPR) repeat protein
VKISAMSAEAKQKGNEAFSAGDYPKAVKQYTMAIRMDKTSCVLLSNRSGAYCGCGKYEEALADAERQGTLQYFDTPPNSAVARPP